MDYKTKTFLGFIQFIALDRQLPKVKIATCFRSFHERRIWLVRYFPNLEMFGYVGYSRPSNHDSRDIFAGLRNVVFSPLIFDVQSCNDYD